jgi:hypothetical protein
MDFESIIRVLSQEQKKDLVDLLSRDLNVQY